MEKVKGFFQKIGAFFKGLFDKFKGFDKKKKITTIVICVLALALIVLGICLLLFVDRKEVSMGNINNKGFADNSGNEIYFFFDNDNQDDKSNEKRGLYKLKGKKVELIDKQDIIRSINVSGNYVYYISINPENFQRKIIKASKNGKNKTTLVDEIESTYLSDGEMIVSGNKIYFIGDNNKLETINKKGEDRTQVSNEEMISFQVVGKEIYFLTKNYELKKMSVKGEDIKSVSSVNMSSFQVVKNSIYYKDNSDDHLRKMNLNGEDSEEVVSGIVDSYNITDGYLYYCKTDNDNNKSSMYKKKLNSDKESKITDLEGKHADICVVGKWIFYTDRIEDSLYYNTVYRIKTDGKDKEMIKVD